MLHYDDDNYFFRGLRIENNEPVPAGLAMRCNKDHVDEVIGKLDRFSTILGWFKSSCVDVVGHVWSSHAARDPASGDPSTALGTVLDLDLIAGKCRLALMT